MIGKFGDLATKLLSLGYGQPGVRSAPGRVGNIMDLLLVNGSGAVANHGSVVPTK